MEPIEKHHEHDMNTLQRHYKQRFGRLASHLYFCPGRVNLIGEHIDYNGGSVMPCAISMGTYLMMSPSQDGYFSLQSIDFGETVRFQPHSLPVKTGNEWFNYPLGIISEFIQNGLHFAGFDMLFAGNLPLGAGLSSSASIEMITAYALHQATGSAWSKLDLVKLTQKVENQYIGVDSGIMDQFAVAFGENNKAILLNCESLVYEYIPADLENYELVIVNSNMPRRLAESKYNERVTECRQGLKELRTRLSIQTLCDLTVEELEESKELIDDQTIWKRLLHVVSENERVLQAKEVLTAGDLEVFGRLMYESHRSLKEDYEVSCRELDTIVEYSQHYEGVIGARMTGAGFGGCAIVLVKSDVINDFCRDLSNHYNQVIGYPPSIYRSKVGAGVQQLTLEDNPIDLTFKV